jgi:hypothetical protein
MAAKVIFMQKPSGFAHDLAREGVETKPDHAHLIAQAARLTGHPSPQPQVRKRHESTHQVGTVSTRCDPKLSESLHTSLQTADFPCEFAPLRQAHKALFFCHHAH